jgi:ubiquinone/menaquinone biosynthesis C-methylase UbiE
VFNSKNINASGLDKSPSMIEIAKKKYPKLEFDVGDANDVMLYPAHTFTHITCLYFTIYYVEDKFSFFRNCYEWLKPGGYLVIHTVNKHNFDPILNAANPFSSLSVQNYAKERVTTSFIKFKDFKYRANFLLEENTENANFEETFTDDNGKVRKNIHKMFMPTQEEIARIGKEAGFIINAKVELDTVQYDNQQLLLLYKPE